jgi:predicted nucleic acid-binding protein
MSLIFWDTNLFIYLFEGTGKEAEQVSLLRERMLLRADRLCTSALSLGEVLVKPIEKGDLALCDAYEDAIRSQAQVVAFAEEAARLYARIRTNRAIKAPDAIQLACAAQAQADLFVTNDDRLTQVRLPGIHFIASLSGAAALLG